MELGGFKRYFDYIGFYFDLIECFVGISEYLTIKSKGSSQLKCVSLKLRASNYIEGVFELLTRPLYPFAYSTIKSATI